mmetsp:Transcript_28005/g.59726  ORF Transcript_28005/g.59726 Transcript_28005/m.59726 type:complete len:214 (+) Transcript_28005:2260-2901(+)
MSVLLPIGVRHRIRMTNRYRLDESLLLPFNGRCRLAFRTILKVTEVSIHNLQPLQQIIVTGKEDARVRRVVELSVELGKLLKAQIGNIYRISTTINTVGIVGEDTLLRLPLQQTIWGRVNSLHFIVNHSLVCQILLNIFEFQMPSLLGMHHGIGNGTWMEHSISVNIDEIVEILGVLTCNHVTCPVGISERIQKCLQRALQQLHEWILRLVLS